MNHSDIQMLGLSGLLLGIILFSGLILMLLDPSFRTTIRRQTRPKVKLPGCRCREYPGDEATCQVHECRCVFPVQREVCLSTCGLCDRCRRNQARPKRIDTSRCQLHCAVYADGEFTLGRNYDWPA